jgi:hypothetical protein
VIQDHAAPGSLKRFGASLLISATLVAPFIVLQLVNRSTFHEDFPYVLFTFMSLHSLLIVLLLTPALRRLRAERSLRALGLTKPTQVLRTFPTRAIIGLPEVAASESRSYAVCPRGQVLGAAAS